MEKKESEFIAYSVLSESECGKGAYTLYVQSIRTEGRYMIMFKSDMVILCVLCQKMKWIPSALC